LHEKDTIIPRKIGNELILGKSKIWTHFSKGKITFTPLDTTLTILGELEYLEGLVKFIKRCKDEKTQQVAQVATTLFLPIIK
jgi:hypothetical protein